MHILRMSGLSKFNISGGASYEGPNKELSPVFLFLRRVDVDK